LQLFRVEKRVECRSARFQTQVTTASDERPMALRTGSMIEIETNRQAELERLVQVIFSMIGDDLYEKLLGV
jgi:hypothetical protein